VYPISTCPARTFSCTLAGQELKAASWSLTRDSTLAHPVMSNAAARNKSGGDFIGIFCFAGVEGEPDNDQLHHPVFTVNAPQ
jgi:hypothetical protein